MNTPNPRPSRIERLPEILFPALAVLLTLAAAWATQHSENATRTALFRQDAIVYANAIEDRLQNLVNDVQVLAQFLAVAPGVGMEDFARFARPLLERNRAIQALEWAPYVPAAARAAFEAEARQQGSVGFRVRERRGEALRPAADRDDYYPVAQVEPLEDNAVVLGFDMGSEPLRRAALERARASGQPVATAPLTLVQETAEQRGLLVVAPYRRAPPAEAAPKRTDLRAQGFAIGAVRLGDLVEDAVSALPRKAVALVLLDAAAPDAARVLCIHAVEADRSGHPSDVAGFVRHPSEYEVAMRVAGRPLELRVLSTAPSSLASSWTLALLAAGFAVSAALGALLRLRLRAAIRLREREERLRLFIEDAPVALAILDREMRYLTASRRWRRDFGWSEQDGRGDARAAQAPAIPMRWRQACHRGLAGEGSRTQTDPFDRPDGSVQWLRWETCPWHDAQGRIAGTAIFAEDITEAQEARLALETQQIQLKAALREARKARLDALTGIANRAGFEERLEQEVARAHRHGSRIALMFIDLDGFKTVNDTQGHQAGDQVLRDIAAVLMNGCRREDLAARYGGDEFAVLLADPLDAQSVAAIAERFREEILALSWSGCSVGASFGIALFPDQADTLPELIRLADEAMYASKAAGKNRVTLAASSPR
ncbi:CHASE domain-containing protein [Thiocystis violacea]|uniref:CHASE domain-containing protein n=1 Tax=Thiocystis violacea TaxID=13725 RepID=UPI001906ECC1|nr:hypothetical protein [Thiocystis violacea]